MSALQLARTVADRYAALRPVQAVALSGSRSSKRADESSDIDLYVYVTHPLTLDQRAQVAAGAKRVEIGNTFWEPGDEWIDPATGIGLDVMYRELGWIEEQIARVLNDHKASIGYSTCFWYNVRNSEMLFDRESWFAQLQEKASAAYPPELKRAIIAKNHPILRTTISSYLHQIEVAQQRHDVVAVNHRITALLASYFDILFALNEQPHPGEKRLLKFAEELCPKRPARMKEDVQQVVDSRDVVAINQLLDRLDELLRQEKLLPL